MTIHIYDLKVGAKCVVAVRNRWATGENREYWLEAGTKLMLAVEKEPVPPGVSASMFDSYPGWRTEEGELVSPRVEYIHAITENGEEPISEKWSDMRPEMQAQLKADHDKWELEYYGAEELERQKKRAEEIRKLHCSSATIIGQSIMSKFRDK